MKKAIRPTIFKWRQTAPELIICAGALVLTSGPNAKLEKAPGRQFSVWLTNAWPTNPAGPPGGCVGGGIRRYVFEVPASEQRNWLQWVQEQRLFYRLALGQPNQEDLVKFLAREGLDPKTVRDTAINLSPWFGDGGSGVTFA